MFTNTRIRTMANPISLIDRHNSLDLMRYMKKVENTKRTGYLIHSSI